MKKIILLIVCSILLVGCKEFKAKKLIYSNLYVGNLDSVYSEYWQDSRYLSYLDSIELIQNNKEYLSYISILDRVQDTLLKEIFFIKSRQKLDNLGFSRYIDSLFYIKESYKPEFIGYRMIVGVENKKVIFYFDQDLKEIIAVDNY